MVKKIVNIYGDITEYPSMDGDMSALKLSQEIDGDYDEIVVNISSFGGSVAEGISIYNQLKAHPAKITTVTNGFCCSIASIIFLAGDERKMYANSIMLIHNAWTACQGNANDLRREADVLEKITDLSIKVYCEKSGLSKDEIKELLDNETWLTSDECLTMGFATELIKDKEEAISQSVKKSLIEIVSQKCKRDKKKHQEVDEDKMIDCPFCDYEGKMPINDDGYFVCPECGRVIKDDQDVIDDDSDDNDGVNESSTQVINESINHNKELNVVSSFLNIFK